MYADVSLNADVVKINMKLVENFLEISLTL